MKIIGLTGGIGMGKSSVAKIFARAGVPVFNADAAVRRLQAPGGAATEMLAMSFPGTVTMRRLEFLIHPLVRHEQARFIAAARRAGKRAVLLDIPLLFETGGQGHVDVSITVSAPLAVQIERVKRRGLPVGQIEAIIAAQMPDAEKRRRADYVIKTGLSKYHTMRQARFVMGKILP
jgi:dephospho-CoA kinase